MAEITVKHCLNCGTEIVKDQHCAETPDQFASRYNSGYCRRKCERLHTPQPKPRSLLPLPSVSPTYGKGELRAVEKEKPVVDEDYRTWVRSLPCLVPGCHHEAQFHHQNERGKGAKGALTSDYRGLPVCAFHHTLGGTERLPGSYHGLAKLTGWKFWQAYGIDVEATIHRLNAMWLEQGNTFKEGK